MWSECYACPRNISEREHLIPPLSHPTRRYSPFHLVWPTPPIRGPTTNDATPTILTTAALPPAMSDSFTSDSDSDSYSLATPEGSTYTPEASTSSLDASVIEIPPATPSHDSALSSVSDSDSNNGGDAEEEWQESLRQLELLISMVIVPFFGKWVGRRTAYWSMFWTPCFEWLAGC